MENAIYEGQSLTNIEKAIEREIPKCEFWGDLELSVDELNILGHRIRDFFVTKQMTVLFMSNNFPHAFTTYMVFFARYKFDFNFWGAISDELGVELCQNDQANLGKCAKKMFSKYHMDTSETNDETKKWIAPILYEACLPPESCLDDLFYILNHDIRIFDPQIIIEELLEMRSFIIRKPMFRFLQRFRDDRAIDFLLEIRDAMMAVDQGNSNSARFVGNYLEWKEEQKSKTTSLSQKENEFQARPYLHFDNGNKGLCIVLPRIVLENEWVENVEWSIKGDNGFSKRVYGVVLGEEGRRFTETIIVPVVPSEKYKIQVTDSEGIDEKNLREWDVDGIKRDRIVLFNSSGRQVNANYLLLPYGIMVASRALSLLETQSISLSEQYYPMQSDEYRIMSVAPLGNDARIKYEVNGVVNVIVARPQINMELDGKTLFDLPSSTGIFTEIPSLAITLDESIAVDGMEIRMGGSVFPLTSLPKKDDVYYLDDGLKSIVDRYGIYGVRLYRLGQFLKQIEFSYVPSIKSTFDPDVKWPDSVHRKIKRELKFARIDDWEMEFEGCNVGFDETYYHVTLPTNLGSIPVTLRSLRRDLRYECHVELPIKPFEAEIVDADGNLFENVTDKTIRIGIDGFLDGEKWLCLRTFGEFTNHKYAIRLKNANGVAQTESIRLAPNGSGNINLSALNETIRNCLLPAELELICDEDENKTYSLLVVSEKLAMEHRVAYKKWEKAYIILGIEDDGKDITVSRFGFKHDVIQIPYEKSKLGKAGLTRGYELAEDLGDGLYVVTGTKEKAIFEFEEEDMIELAAGNNIIDVRPQIKAILSSSELLSVLIKEILNTDSNADLKGTKAFQIAANSDELSRIQEVQFDDISIEKLVALAYFVNSKIANAKKENIRYCMRLFSERFMHRGDRYRIMELLVELDAPQEIFDICLKEYALLLCYSNNGDVRRLASRVDPYSAELSMVLLMSTDAPVRDCLLRERYRDLVGKDAIRTFLSVPNESDPEIIAEEQLKFMREIPGGRVRINLTYELTGNEEAIQGMIGYDAKYKPCFDISKKPDYGVYFAGIRYVDQYVNWFRNVHDRNLEMKPEIRKLMLDIVKENYKEIMECIAFLKKEASLSNATKQYDDVLKERFHEGTSIVSFSVPSKPRYFYLQGLAAYLAKLPVDRERFDDFRTVGIRFMSAAYVIAPRLAQRDILMAETFIYLKRKEEKLCQ